MVSLRLFLHVYDVDDDGDGFGSCTPLTNAKVDIWHADSQGIYSGVRDAGTGQNNFLRGYQMTDDNGTVQFTTIYPGWYEGRAIHIHAKVRTFDGSNETLEWTSQFYLNNSINEQVHTQPPYNNHGPVDVTNEEDFIYIGPSSDGLVKTNTGQHLMLKINEDEQEGYTGTFNIGINANQSGQ
jgi:protocatechuate 3,4-dioxygenase beta subunit